MTGFVENFANLDTLAQVHPLLLDGLRLTAWLVLTVVPLGMGVGLGLAVLGSVGSRPLRVLLIGYIDLLRSFPPLVLLILVYYGGPFLGLRLPEFSAAVLALVLNSSSYYGEIFRAGIESIPREQHEAARATGLSVAQTLRFVILPQAIKNVVPPLTSNTVEVIKLTSIASVVALPELLRAALIAQGLVYNPTPLMAVAVLYAVVLWPLVRLVSRFERQLLAWR
ncbi:MAG TPA: amino acid ABC transporter permease, partial [Methylomirabilota bacterium]|jgi:polar amino acid transport system permease protein|nr:amino acid ABC transporter permease [Methylomirabilota bacterium]